MFTNESSICCLDIIKHKWLCSVKCYILVKYLRHCVTLNSKMHSLGYNECRGQFFMFVVVPSVLQGRKPVPTFHPCQVPNEEPQKASVFYYLTYYLLLIWGHLTHETESPWPLPLQALSLVENAGPVRVRFTLRLRGPTEWVCACWMDVKSTWIPTWHQMDHVSWSLGLFIKNHHLLVVGITQNYWETLALQTPTTVDLFYSIMREDPHE